MWRRSFVATTKCCQNSDVFEEICIASRTKSKCDALKDGRYDCNQHPQTAKVDADNANNVDEYKP